MAPISPDNTPRFRINYTVNSYQHDFQLRGSMSPAALGILVDNFLVACDPSLYAIVINTVDFAASGSNVFLPVTTGIEGNSYGAGSPIVQEVPTFYGFVGRSVAGVKWTLKLYGAMAIGVNFRFSPGENGDLDAAVAVLNAGSPPMQAIDGQTVVVYTYVNAGLNAYWQRKLR